MVQVKAALFFAAIVLLAHQLTFASSTSDSFYYSIDSQSNPFNETNFYTYGSGFVNITGITLTREGDADGSVVFYNQPMPLGNGFYTEFNVKQTNCDTTPGYYGADGFAFVVYPQRPSSSFIPNNAGSLGITASSNLVAVGFDFLNDLILVCAVNSSSTFGGGALKDDTTHCLRNTTNGVLKSLRCNNTRQIRITYLYPDSWEVTVSGNNAIYLFTKDIGHTLNWDRDYTGYVGISGSVTNAGYMNQLVTYWNTWVNAGCVGACDPNALCDYVNNTAYCSCPNGFEGDGYVSCVPILQKANIVPILECFEKFGDGAYEAYYGYNSMENGPVKIARGPNNDFSGYNGAINIPEIFEPGRTLFYPANAFSVEITNPDPFTLTWHLGDYQVSFNSDDNSKRCSQDLSVLLRFTTGRRLDANETALILDQLYSLIGVSFGRISIRNVTYSPNNMKRQSATELAELELEISSTNSTTQTEPRASQAVQQLIDASTNTTRMNEVINPDPDNQDPDRTFVGVKTTPSGTETVGQVVPQPMAPIVDVYTPTIVPITSISSTISFSTIVSSLFVISTILNGRLLCTIGY